MAWLGRESPTQQQRAERLAAWMRAQNTPALLSVPLGLVAVVDAVTMVLGLAAGVAAVVLGLIGWRQTAPHPRTNSGERPQGERTEREHCSSSTDGRGLAVAGIVLGLLGVALSITVALLIRAAE